METAESIKIHIRWQIRRDMPEVMGIERDSFEHPWSEEEFVLCLRRRNVIGLVAEHEERVVAFMIYETNKTRLHILNMAVAADMRRRGIGRQLLEYKIAHLPKMRRTSLTLEVRESNVAAQLFFRSAGFKATSVLRGFYDETDEDAYLFAYRVAECSGK